MGANLNIQNFVQNAKTQTADTLCLNSPCLNSTNISKAPPALNNPIPLEQKPDRFVSSKEKPENNNKNKKLLYFAGLLGAAFAGAFAYKLFLKLKPKNIKRFKQIDDTLYRGAKPTKAQYKKLKKEGITRVIAFNRSPEISGGSELEKDVAKSLGIKFTNLKVSYEELPSDKQIKKFFKIMDDARKNNEKIYIHCTHGKDRTGLFSAMYKIKYGLSNTEDAIYEMVSMNHDYKKHPQMIKYLKSGRFLNIK